MKRRLIPGVPALLMLAAMAPAADAAAPKVVVSIKPLHSLVAGVMAGVASPDLLLGGGASPHHYALKPGEAKLLSEADLIVSIGPRMELFLAKPIEALAGKTRHLATMESPGVTVLRARAGGVWEAHAHAEPAAKAKGGDHNHDHGHDHDHDHDHDKAATRSDDTHIWLDPRNAKAMTAAIAATLSDVDAPNAQRYRANADALAKRIDALDAELAVTLKPLADRPFVVFHDAFQYFENRYGLRAVGSITVTPEAQPGARRIKQVKDKITQLGAACVFAEPGYEPRLVSMLTAETGARSGELDPEGTTLTAGPDLYFTLMRAIGSGLAACLAPNG